MGRLAGKVALITGAGAGIGSLALQRQLLVRLAPGRTVEQAVEFVVGLGVAVAHLGLAAQHLVEDQLGHQA